MLYCINVLVNALVLDIAFCQLLDVTELELLSSGRLLRVLVDDAPRRRCDNDRRPGDP